MLYYPFNPNSHYNKFGYYRVGQDLTYSKWEAMNISSRTKHPVEWIFNDDIYDQIDWANEPEISLHDLYRIRAQQIRDQYDYIVLMYSGGADSHNVLMSFVENGIHVDEVAHMIELDGDRDLKSFANAEITRVAWPLAAEIIKSRLPGTQQRLIDITKIILSLPEQITAEEYLTATSAWMTPANLARSFLREKISHYMDIISSGKKLCFVWGADKPNLAVLHDRESATQNYAVVFSDRESCLVSPRQKYLSRPWEHDEFFYWSPDLPELVCKQAHLLKKLATLPRELAPPDHYTASSSSHGLFKEFGWSIQNQNLCVLTQDAGHIAIYPHWDTGTFSSGKTVSRVFSDRDRWLFKDMNATDTGRLFESVVSEARTSEFWRNDKHGFPVSFSKLYPLTNGIDINRVKISMPHDSSF